MASQMDLIVTVRILNGFTDFLTSHGLLPEDIARKSGVDASIFNVSDAFVSFDCILKLFEAAAQALGDDAFGLHFAEAYPVGPVGHLHYIMTSSPTVRDAIRQRVRYTRLVTNAYVTSFEKRDGSDYIVWNIATDIGPRTQFTDYVVTLLVQRIRLLLGNKSWMPPRVDFDHREPYNLIEFHRVLGPRLRFNCPVTMLGIDTAALDKPVASADPTLLHVLETMAGEVLKRVGEENFVDRVVEQIVKALPTGDTSAEAIAAALGVSGRTLQRNLQRLGTTYQTLRNETRYRTAERLIHDTDIALTEVAFLLGFSELSAFSRAAKKWFRQSASEARKQRGSDYKKKH